MALARPSPIIGAISGSLSSCIFSNTRHGLVISQRSRHVDPATHSMLNTRAAIAQLRADWVTSPTLDRQSFVAAARTVSWPNRLGLPKNPSGFDLFCCQNLTFTGGPHTTVYPSIIACSGVTTPQPTVFSVAASESDGVAVTADNDSLFLGSIYQVLYASAQCRPGQTYFPRSWTRIGRKNVTTATTSWYPPAWPNFPPIRGGMTIAFRLVWIYYFNVPSAPVSCIVNATA